VERELAVIDHRKDHSIHDHTIRDHTPKVSIFTDSANVPLTTAAVKRHRFVQNLKNNHQKLIEALTCVERFAGRLRIVRGTVDRYPQGQGRGDVGIGSSLSRKTQGLRRTHRGGIQMTRSRFSFIRDPSPRPPPLPTPMQIWSAPSPTVKSNHLKFGPEWIQEAMEEIDRRTAMCFRPVNFEDRVDGNALIRVFTRCFPLLEVSRVEVDGADLNPSSYVVNKRTGSITFKEGVFAEGYQNVLIEGVSGYNKVPPLIEKIATLIVAKTALSAKNGALVDSESIGDFSQNRSFKKLNDELDRAWEAWGTRAGIDFAS
jgi:hypothetical protein